MKKYYFLVLMIGLLFVILGGCINNKEDENTNVTVISFDELFVEGSNTENILEDDLENEPEESYEAPIIEGIMLSAVESLEDTLPYVYGGNSFPENIRILSQCDGDLGSDGVNNIAVIMQGYEVDKGTIYALCVFEENTEGRYSCVQYTENLLIERESDDWGTEYYKSVQIKDGKLCVRDNTQLNEYVCYESIWGLNEGKLILEEIIESTLNSASGNGIETRYAMHEGTVVCKAVSLWNTAIDERLIWEGSFANQLFSLEEVKANYIPQIAEANKHYSQGGEEYNYHILGLTDGMLMDFSNDEEWKVAYVNCIDDILKANEDAGRYTFDLLYIDEDNIPELVYGVEGYWVSVCTYAPGMGTSEWTDIAVIMEDWPYGAGGNVGYEYLPGENIMRNYNSNQAGAERYTSYFKVGSNKEVEDIYYLRFVKKEITGTDNSDADDSYTEYYYGEQQVTKEEYNSYIIDGDFKYIIGNQDAYKIVTELCKGKQEVVPEWKEAYLDVIDAVKEEYALEQAEADSLTYDLIYLDGDYIPELVIGRSDKDAWVSVYTYAYGRSAEGIDNVTVLVDEWRYNYGCNYGYDYVPEKGVIEEFIELHGNGFYYKHYYMIDNVELKEGQTFKCWREWISEAEGYVEYYYRDDEEFTQERWDYFWEERSAKTWEDLEGTKSYNEIVEELSDE